MLRVHLQVEFRIITLKEISSSDGEKNYCRYYFLLLTTSNYSDFFYVASISILR